MHTGPRRLAYNGYGGIALVGDVWGDLHAPPVLLLHGGGQTRHAWADTAAALAKEGWCAVALDQRGHGESDWAEDEDYTLDAFAADVMAVAAALPEPPVLVGASLGGMAGLLAHGEMRHKLAALVLVDITPRMELDGVQRIASFMIAHLKGFATVEEAADAIARYLPHRPRPTDLGGLEKNLRRRPDGRYYWHWDPNFLLGPRSVASSRRPERLSEAARNIVAPTLLVRGKQSDMVSEAGAAEFLEAVPHACYVDVSNATHMVVGDRNDVFSAAVLDFLRDFHAASDRDRKAQRPQREQ